MTSLYSAFCGNCMEHIRFIVNKELTDAMQDNIIGEKATINPILTILALIINLHS